MAMQDLRKEYIEEAIAGIGAQLVGPMSSIERQLLIADRRDFRAELQRRAVAEPVDQLSGSFSEGLRHSVDLRLMS